MHVSINYHFDRVAAFWNINWLAQVSICLLSIICIAFIGLSHPRALYFAGISQTRWFPDSWGCWYFPVCWCTSGDQCGANAGASLTPQSSQSSFQSSVIIICKPGSHLSKFPKIAAFLNPPWFSKKSRGSCPKWPCLCPFRCRKWRVFWPTTLHWSGCTLPRRL